MRKSLGRIVLGTGVIALVGVGAVGVAIFRQLSPPLPPPLASLASVAVHDIDGVPHPLGDRLHPSAVTIVSFWADWCVPCRAEATVLARLATRYPPRVLNVIYLNVDDAPDTAAFVRFLAQTRATTLAPLVAGRAGWRAITGSTSAVTLPRTYIFDRAGRPTKALGGFGPKDADALTAIVAQAARLVPNTAPQR